MKKLPSILKLDEKRLVRRLANLTISNRTAFAAACAERLRPRLAEHNNKTGIGDPAVLEKALSLLWADLISEKGLSKTDLRELIVECETQYLDDNICWIDESNYVEDAVASAQYALQCRGSSDAQAAAWAARCVYETLDRYVVICHDFDFNVPKDMKSALEHPLVQAELHRQQRDLAELETSTASFEVIRDRARTESAILFDELSARQYLEFLSNI
jgi:hypothetical protein